jgi:hypothetical protein
MGLSFLFGCLLRVKGCGSQIAAAQCSVNSAAYSAEAVTGRRTERWQKLVWHCSSNAPTHDNERRRQRLWMRPRRRRHQVEKKQLVVF